MKYLTFRIENYKGIKGPLKIDVHRYPLLPIIGLNESGKTTILEAILAFDEYSDSQNSGRHLKDVMDLTDPGAHEPTRITALIELDSNWLPATLQKLLGAAEVQQDSERVREVRAVIEALALTPAGFVELTRTLGGSNSYEFCVWKDILHEEQHSALANELLRQLPHILFFDDFRTRRTHTIPLTPKEDDEEWTEILTQLFKKAGTNVPLDKLPGLDERLRGTTLSRAESHLRSRLADQWASFQLAGPTEAQMSIRLKYVGTPKPAITIEVVEHTEAGDVVFNVSDRSKGFFWFFNFVMKLEFNPKSVGSITQKAIFLLDEPGSFLHATAQKRLCVKLRELAEENAVIYSSHSHHLLDPSTVPYSSVHVASRASNGQVNLGRLVERKTEKRDLRRTQYQPIMDALKTAPAVLDVIGDRVVLVEGMDDYHILTMLVPESCGLTIVPGVNADSLQVLSSLCFAATKPFVAIFDDDDEGRTARDSLREFFGQRHEHRFLCYSRPTSRRSKKTLVQNLIDGSDIREWRERTGIPTGGITKLLTAVFYSPDRDKILSATTPQTRASIQHNIDAILAAIEREH